MKQETKKPAGRCLFCHATGVTKEHVVSEWLKQLLPTTRTHTQRSGRNDKFRPTTIRTRVRQGTFQSRKIRKVCARCNNGWMSQIVSRTKPYITAMVKGESVQLPKGAQVDVASWIALVTIMAEFTCEGGPTIPEQDREYLRLKHEPPPHWTILIGRFGGSMWAPSGFRHAHRWCDFSQAVIRANEPIDVLVGVARHKLQVTTFVLGSLLFHCFSSTSRETVATFRQSWIPRQMSAIWPIVDSNITFYATPLLGDADAALIADAFVRSFR